MAREPSSNIGLFCPEHAPKVDKRWMQKKPSYFIGKFVKRPFKVVGHPKVTIEHMWIKVTGVDAGVLVGILENEPQFTKEYKHKNIVQCELGQIEQVLDDKGKEVTP
jgi:uncharacterized protein YegJ (DUF2314 family)